VTTKKAVELPTTVDGAVRIMLGMVPYDEQARIASLSEDYLVDLHMGLGQWIRNSLGLWDPDSQLMAATGESNADDASFVLIRAFWLKLQDDLPKVH